MLVGLQTSDSESDVLEVNLDVRERLEGYLALGKISLRNVRGTLDLTKPEDLSLNGSLYSEWVLTDNYLVMKKTIDRLRLDGNATYPEERVRIEEYDVHKARKRGNDVDSWRLESRMRGILESITPYCESSDPEKPLRDSRAVYVTLTVDQTLYDGDLDSAWRSLGRTFNNFKSRISKTFGTVLVEVVDDKVVSHVKRKVASMRSFESHGGEKSFGWPHIHAVMCFEDYHFRMFKDAKGKWRIKDKDRFQDAWPYGFVDVSALTPGTAEGALKNVLWYVMKNKSDMDYRLVRSWPQKRLLTQSIMWYLGMRSFSISKSLVPTDTEGSQYESNERLSTIQKTVFGEDLFLDLVKYEFLGLVDRGVTELDRSDWEKVYSEPPDWLDRVWKPYSSRSGSGVFSSWLSGGS